MIVARGGYSGLFPESSEYAYQFATATGISGGVGLFCDLQLTKDGAGICRTDLRLDNSTNIGDIFPKGKKSYPVNGKPVSGWFSVDFTVDQMFSNVTSKSQFLLCICKICIYIVYVYRVCVCV